MAIGMRRKPRRKGERPIEFLTNGIINRMTGLPLSTVVGNPRPSTRGPVPLARRAPNNTNFVSSKPSPLVIPSPGFDPYPRLGQTKAASSLHQIFLAAWITLPIGIVHALKLALEAGNDAYALLCDVWG